MKYVIDFKKVTLKQIPLVGGKNASLGQMIRDLGNKKIPVPGGFAVTVDGYRDHLSQNDLEKKIAILCKPLKNPQDTRAIQRAGKAIRSLILKASLPKQLVEEISIAYEQMSKALGQQNCLVAVRSSATAEDLPDASFAGQQETFLCVRGIDEVLISCKKSMASLFTDRAIAYRIEKKFNQMQIALSVGVQHMVRSDKAVSGVMFTIDTESGFKDVVVINSSYGLGELIVKGEIIPDEFHVFKPTFLQGYRSIIKKRCGSKQIQMVHTNDKRSVIVKNVAKKASTQFSLKDDEILELSRMGIEIEKHYSNLKKSWSPMDIEWAKDGINGTLYIVQARPETIHSGKNLHALEQYKLKNASKAKVLLQGQSIGQKIVQGTVRVIKTVKDMNQVRPGEILVTRMTDPDWVSVMKTAVGIITDNGGRTCHAAIVSREIGIPALVGTVHATKLLKTGQKITIDCSIGSEGLVYEGFLAFSKDTIEMKKLPKTPVPIYLHIAAPDMAYKTATLPVDGVGLSRMEFIISNDVQMHPMACSEPKKILHATVKKQIKELTRAYENDKEFFVQQLAHGIGTIAAAFYPRSVLVRFSDFKSNEYRNLLGGIYYEPIEENPMIGLRGASRYYHPLYASAFLLECEAIMRVRNEMGLNNVNVMVPFVRTVQEAEKVIAILKKQKIVSSKDLKIFMMCEIPSNVLLLESFAHYFDGFSIGSNDLTQTTLSVDRDSGLIASLFDERDPAVKILIKQAILTAKRMKKPIGCCGQAPSDYPDIAQFLLDCGISNISLNPDSVLPFLMRK